MFIKCLYEPLIGQIG